MCTILYTSSLSMCRYKYTYIYTYIYIYIYNHIYYIRLYASTKYGFDNPRMELGTNESFFPLRRVSSSEAEAG